MFKFYSATHTFGEWTVLDDSEGTRSRSHWLCRCVCGTERRVLVRYLFEGRSKGCGCSRYKSLRKRPFEWLYNHLVLDAKRRSKFVGLTYEEFLEFTKKPTCHYCEAPLVWEPHLRAISETRNARAIYNLDRKNNSLGYVKENLVECCGRCNAGKGGRFSYKEWVIMTAALRNVLGAAR